VIMTENKIADNQDGTLEDLVINHAYEMVGLITVLEKKGILTRAEIIEEIKNLKH